MLVREIKFLFFAFENKKNYFEDNAIDVNRDSDRNIFTVLDFFARGPNFF